MVDGAQVRSIDALKDFRTALAEFADLVRGALGSAQSDVQRTVWWIEHDLMQQWQMQFKKREAKFVDARNELFRAELAAADGRARTTIQKMEFEKAKRAVAEAKERIENIKKWSRRLERDFSLYKASCQQLNSAVDHEVPRAVAKMDNMIEALEQYIRIALPTLKEAALAGASEGGASAKVGGAPSRKKDDRKKKEAYIEGAELRHLTPAGAVRATIETPDDVKEGAPPDLTDALARSLGLDPEPINPAGTVTAVAGILEEKRVYLQRVDPAGPDDTGWFVGTGRPSDAEASLIRISVGRLVKKFGAAANLLALPEGCLAVIDCGKVTVVLDEDDRRVGPVAGGDA